MDPERDIGPQSGLPPDAAGTHDSDASSSQASQPAAPDPSASPTPTDGAHRSHRRRRSHRGDGPWRVSPRRRSLVLLAGLVLVVAAVIGIPYALGGFGGTTPSATPTQAAVLPSETLPPPSASGTETPSPSPTLPGQSGAPGEPGIVADRVQVPRLGIDLPIVQGDGIDAPLGKAAHYPGTAWPEGGSNIYLYAHARDGMFIGLWKARVGDQVIVHLSNGTDRTYVVSKIDPKVAWNDMRVIAPTATEQLSLQTCNSYQQTAPRFLVIAVPAA